MSRHIMWQEPTLKKHLDVLLKPSIGILCVGNAPGFGSGTGLVMGSGFKQGEERKDRKTDGRMRKVASC